MSPSQRTLFLPETRAAFKKYMDATIRKSLEDESKKLISRHHLRIRQCKKNQSRFRKRTGKKASEPNTYEPGHWDAHEHFNPFYVRRSAKTIVYTLAKKIRAKEYVPKPCLIQKIPKATGGQREISIFTVPDAAVATYLYKLLNARNAQLFSAYSYAYRADRNAHHAIQHLHESIKGRRRLYILEYDFSDFFGSIDHEYITKVLSEKFMVSPREMYLIKQFLQCKRANGIKDYKQNRFEDCKKGIPQGSSISLFLANVACVELDHEIEQAGAVFARYADDTVIICENYDQANKCAELMLSHGKRAKTEINFRKSIGISLLTPDKTAEMRCKSSFDFLGHNLSPERISISSRSVQRIKRRISTAIYRHLLLYPRKNMFSKSRIDSTVDWDFVTCINEVRRYIYGKMGERELSKCISDRSEPLVLSRCLLSYYPLVTDDSIFRQLDGWLVNVFQRAQKARKHHIKKHTQSYHLYTKQELLTGSWYTKGIPNEVKLPSFFKSWQYVRKCLNVYGMMRFPSPEYTS